MKILSYKKFLGNEGGATAIEYGMVGALIGTVLIGGATAVGSQSSTKYNLLSNHISGNWVAAGSEISSDTVTGAFETDAAFSDPNQAGYARTTSMQGWEATGAGKVDFMQNGFRGIHTRSGNDMIDLRSDTDDNGGLKQTLTTLTPGQAFEVNLDAIDTTGGDNTRVEIFHNGASIGTIDPTNTFDGYASQSFTATGNDVIEIRELGTHNSHRGTIISDLGIVPS